MKYFNITGINRAISLIREVKNTQEHVTSRATSSMINFYFKEENGWHKTPEQIKETSNKRPDYIIEKFVDRFPYFLPHCFVEVKSLVNSNIGAILDQLYDTTLFTVDTYGNYSRSFSTFMIAVKGTKIAFYTYHNFITLLDEYYIPHYEWFIPLNYIIPWFLYKEINAYATLRDYDGYMRNCSMFHTNESTLSRLGAVTTNDLKHPHILDLFNEGHKNDIDGMWKHVLEHSPYIFSALR